MTGETSQEDEMSLSGFFENFEFDQSGAIIFSNPVLNGHPMNPTPVPVVSQQKHKSQQCPYSTNDGGNFKTHLRTDSRKQNFSCLKCGSAYTQLIKMHKHQQLMHMEEHHNLCPPCRENFKNNETFGAHDYRRRVIQTAATKSEQKHKCEQCSYSSNNVTNFTNHRRTHTGEKPHKCPHCGEAFTQNGTLHRHLRVHSGERLSSCSICGAPFSNLRSLNRHERRWHTGRSLETLTERKYKCDQCSYSTNKLGSLSAHLLTHTGVKPHKCPHCGEAFTQKGNLQRHLRVHSGERLFSCSICGAPFSELRSMHKHEIRHFRESPVSLNESERKLGYEKCPDSTNRSNELQHHMLTHMGEKPYRCPDCPRAFKWKESLEYHVCNHMRERQFSCNMCHVAFPSLELLLRHEQTHSQNPCVCPTCMTDFPDLNTYLTHKCEKYVIEESQLALLGI